MSVAVVVGAEDYEAPGGPYGVLVVHGHTSNPSSIRELAQRCAAQGFRVSAPRLPGHGTSVEELEITGWSDWTQRAHEALHILESSCDKVALVGLSLGGAICIHLAARHRQVTAVVIINPVVEHPGRDVDDEIAALVASGVQRLDSPGSDIKREGAPVTSYEQTPLTSLVSLLDALDSVSDDLTNVVAPTLLFSSREDHTVRVSNGDRVVRDLGGPVERVWLENSYHVATLDNDQELVESMTVEFLLKQFRA